VGEGMNGKVKAILFGMLISPLWVLGTLGIAKIFGLDYYQWRILRVGALLVIIVISLVVAKVMKW